MNRKRQILFIALTTVIIIIGFLIFDYVESMKNIYSMQRSQALTLITAMNSDFKHTLETNTQLEGLIISQLNTSALLIQNADKSRIPNIKKISKIADDNEISSVCFLDRNGKLLQTTDSNIYTIFPTKDFLDDFMLLKKSDSLMLDLGIIENPYSHEKHYYLLRKRKHSDTYILVGMGNKKLMELRRNFGIGAKLAEFSKSDEITYIVLQDEYGIYAASSNSLEISSLQQDEELLDAITKRQPIARIYNFQGTDVFEVSQVLQVDEDNILLTRIGLNQSKIQEIKSNELERNILAAALSIAIFVIIIIYILTREKLINLGVEHFKIQTYIQLLLENVADGVIILDSKKKIIVFNDAAQKALDINKTAALGRNYSEVFDFDYFNIDDALKTNTSQMQSSIKFTTKKTNVNYLTFTTNLAYNFDELDSILIFIRDITEQVKIQKQIELKEKQAAISQLASGIAHEIRNPLNAIYIIIQRFQIEFQTVKGNEEFQKLLKTIRSEIVRINEIIEQFLDFSRPQKLVIERVDVSALMDDVISLIENLAIRQRVEISKHYKPYIYAEIDEKKIKQVLLNLIQNSFDSMPEGGDLDLSISQDQFNFNIRVTDTGIGISEELKNKIFTLYFTTKKDGHGLGLAIVHQIITEHNGDIAVYSNEGKGTTFELTIPNKF